MPTRYYEVERMLAALKKLPEFNVDIKSYRYLQAPSEPLTKDKPQKVLILVLGFLLGIIMCSLLVLLLAVFKNTNSIRNPGRN